MSYLLNVHIFSRYVIPLVGTFLWLHLAISVIYTSLLFPLHHISRYLPFRRPVFLLFRFPRFHPFSGFRHRLPSSWLFCLLSHFRPTTALDLQVAPKTFQIFVASTKDEYFSYLSFCSLKFHKRILFGIS